MAGEPARAIRASSPKRLDKETSTPLMPNATGNSGNFERKNRSAKLSATEEYGLLSKGLETDMSPNLAANASVWDRAWNMVEQRSLGADSLFVYAVRTTGIYCRPSCPSRRPMRHSVEFFATSDLAERAGYRPCKRCRPAEEHPHQRVITAACEYIDAHLDQTVRLEELSKVTGLSQFHLQRIFRRALGISPRQYQQARRLDSFRERLGTGVSVTTAVYDAGFSSSSRLYENAQQQMGMTPAQYRRNAKGMRIRYGIAQSRIGKVLAAVTDVGVCSVCVGDLETELEDSLRQRFAEAELVRDDAGVGDTLEAVLSKISEHPSAVELPLDIRATAFQQRVWRALGAIPRGETRSYAQLAAELGNPKAVRAVARACASNPVAVVIPCHRIVGSDGSLTGYRWGVDRKKKLLELEGARTH